MLLKRILCLVFAEMLTLIPPTFYWLKQAGHIWAIAEHLQAVAERQIKRLPINVPVWDEFRNFLFSQEATIFYESLNTLEYKIA